MVIEQGDYVQGTEYYGAAGKTRNTKGWVNKVRQDGDSVTYDIQADDGYGGARGTTLTTELGPVVKLEPKQRPSATR